MQYKKVQLFTNRRKPRKHKTMTIYSNNVGGGLGVGKGQDKLDKIWDWIGKDTTRYGDDTGDKNE